MPIPVSPQLIPAALESDPDLGPTHGTYQREGSIIGAIVLGLVGFVLISQICGDGEASDREEHCGTEAAGGGVVGLVAGYALGSLIGKSITKR
jgi:hypothetical protein